MREPKYSIVIPVYNRPEEVDELLQSLVGQTYANFEVLIVEDGSTRRCDEVVERYQDKLGIRYFFKQNEGPGPARNLGYRHATGDYFVVFDSDCILPLTYFEAVEKGLETYNLDAWGGPDRAHQNFTLVQRAMGYTMASFLTTGGIRGGKKHMGWFQPRSFNMGISRKVYDATGGFRFNRYAEDIELSIRMKNAGFKVGLLEEAFVFHKRRANFKQFYQQVCNFGKGRVLIGKAHPSEVKLTHWFPALFVLGSLSLFLLPLLSTILFKIGLIAFCLYLGSIFFHALIVNKNIVVALLSVPSALIQLYGYGIGFLKERFKKYL